MPPNFPPILLCGLVLTLRLAAEPSTDYREWTSVQGTTTEARLLRVDRTKEILILALKDGRRIEIKPEQLNKSDQKYAKQLLAQGDVSDEMYGSGITFFYPNRHRCDYDKRRGRSVAVKSDDPKVELFYEMPNTWSQDRTRIPNFGVYNDGGSDFSRSLTNHFLWFANNNAINLGTSSNQERLWKKAFRTTKKLNYGNSSHRLQDWAKPFEKFQNEIKTVTQQGRFAPSLTNLKKAITGTNFVLIRTMGENKNGRETYSYTFSATEMRGDKIVINYRQERTEATLQVIEKTEDSPRESWLRFDPLDQSSFVENLRDDGVELHFDHFYVFSFEFWPQE